MLMPAASTALPLPGNQTSAAHSSLLNRNNPCANFGPTTWKLGTRRGNSSRSIQLKRGLPGKFVHVDVEDALVAVNHVLHGVADRLAIDPGARVRVVDVAVIVKRAVASEQDDRVVGAALPSRPKRNPTRSAAKAWGRARSTRTSS